MNRLLAVLFTGLTVLSATEARAGTIAPNCGTCGTHNTGWDLTLSLINDASNVYQLTVTATYGSPVDFVFVNAIAFKIDSFTGQYEANPSVTGPAEDSWNVVFGGLSNGGAGGCSGSGNGFWCANSANLGATHGAAGTTDTWTFLLNLNNGLANVTSATGSFKAHFTDALGVKVGSNLSEEGVTFGPPTTSTAAPEPATLLLFGTGLAAAATALRRRRKKS
jgi:hypothetical protein